MLVSYKRALVSIDKDLASYYKKYAVDDILPKDRLRKAKQLTGLKKNVDSEIMKLQNYDNKLIANNLAETYRHSYYRTAHALETEIGADLGFSMVNPKAVKAVVANKMGLVKWPASSKANALLLTKRIKGSIEQGLIQGHSLQKTARLVQKQMNIGAGKAIRIIRTETLRSRIEGTLAGYDEAEAEGLPFERVWLSTLGPRTRESHIAMDKEVADSASFFHLPSGVLTRGPGLSGIAEEDINCRCDVIVEIPTIDPSKFRAARDPVTGVSVNVKNMDYDEWALVKKIKSHESVYAMAPEKLISRMKYVELRKGEKSWRALYYDWAKLKQASGQILTRPQLKFFNANFNKYDATSIRVKGKIVTEPLSVPKPKPPSPPAEVKFSEGILKEDNFRSPSLDWDKRLEQHTAALRQRMGFDLKELSLGDTFAPAFKEAEKKFATAIKSFTKPSKKVRTDVRNVFPRSGNVSNAQLELQEKHVKKSVGKFLDVIDDIGGNNTISHFQDRVGVQLYDANYRANADGAQFLIRMSVADNIDIYFHELGHLLEANRSTRNKAMLWLKKRGGKEGKIRYSKIAIYSDDIELAYKNKFIGTYVGKVYTDGQTEAISMGLQQFATVKKMMKFAKKDFDHFAFIHGILTGAI